MPLPGTLPSAWEHQLFGFECPLAGPASVADFLLSATVTGGGRRALVALGVVDHTGRLLTEPVWQRVRDFAEQWTDEASPLSTGVDNVWLEFDVANWRSPVPSETCFSAYS